jgi:diguanylate cyclase (GGDEF)-like protein
VLSGNGLSALIFCGGIVILLIGAYGGGVMGAFVTGVLLAMGWLVMGFYSWADLTTFAVEGLTGGLAFWIALRWALRHRAWEQRQAKDFEQAKDRTLQVEGAVQQLRETVAAKSADVERSLKQYEMVKVMAQALSWEEMAPSLERALKHFFRVEAWGLHLANEKAELELVHRRGVIPELKTESLSEKDPFLQTHVVATGVDQGKTVWVLNLPLWRLHERIGMLVLRIPDFPPDQRAALLAEANSFATQLVFAMAKAKLYRELDQRSRTDGLTGLSRRGPFEERLREEVARAESFRSTFSVLMIDIDHFKRFNDGYGHQVGDEVLRTVSQLLKEGLYETDQIARFGGEEFVCLLPRSQPAGLKIKAEQIRARVANHSFVIGLEAVQVTISIGIAHFPQDGRTPQAVLEAADRALYAAKDAGRNCVIEAASVSGL